MTKHEQAKEAAQDAARALHSDTSVPLQQTRDSLQELRGEVDALIAAVDDDLRREEGEA